MKQMLEEYIENYNKLPNGVFKTYVGGYIDGTKWQQENQDNFAIEFANWINKVSYRSFDGNWYLTQIEKDIKKTTEELLEIYKKEKEL